MRLVAVPVVVLTLSVPLISKVFVSDVGARFTPNLLFAKSPYIPLDVAGLFAI
jgi:hypothetical protein